MAAVANNPAFAKKVGISKSVGEEFMKADKGKKFGAGGSLKAVDSSDNPGLSKLPTEVRNKMGYMKKGGMAKKGMKEGGMMDVAQDKAMIKKAFKQHDMQEHKGDKGTKLALKKGGILEKGTGEKYASKAAMMKHEKKESKTEEMKEYGMKKGGKVSPKFVKEMEKAYPKGATVSPMKKGGMAKGCGYSKGGQLAKANGVAVRGKTKGKNI